MAAGPNSLISANGGLSAPVAAMFAAVKKGEVVVQCFPVCSPLKRQSVKTKYVVGRHDGWQIPPRRLPVSVCPDLKLGHILAGAHLTVYLLTGESRPF